MTTIKNAAVRGVLVAEIKKPPQRARTNRDRKWMDDWLEAVLWKEMEERIEAIERYEQTPEEIKEMEEGFDQGEAIWLAETHGIMEPVRKRFPRLAKLLNPPPRPGKGKRFPKNKFTRRCIPLSTASCHRQFGTRNGSAPSGRNTTGPSPRVTG